VKGTQLDGTGYGHLSGLFATQNQSAYSAQAAFP
jgi:hypothetical protein